MKKYILVVLLLFAVKGISQDVGLFLSKTDAFLKVNVKDGKVAYEDIYTNQSDLNEVLKIAENISVSIDDDKTYQAFWINVYNLCVIKGIINNYPINSPLDKPGFFDKDTFSIAGKQVTLNEIEHELLRAQFKDPRFHFVLVCGALGCPPLINEAYLLDTLDAQLEEQTKLALNGDFLKVNTKKKRVQASQIMEWYKEDFTLNGNTEIDFINTYREEKLEGKYKLSYFPYNWNLNKQ